MSDKTNATTDEAQIRSLIDDWVIALKAKDMDGLMANYAPEVLLFDLMPPLQHDGAEAYRELWNKCFSMCDQTTASYEILQLKVTVSGGIAFSHGLHQMSTSGGHEMVMRVTSCYRKIEGRWLVIHDHFSVPIDMEKNQPLMNLKP